MYYAGHISVDPSQLTKIKKIEPSGTFKKLLFQMSAGLISEKEEQETFTAISILQQIYASLIDLNIDNMVRLSQDNLDYYLDKEGKQHDLKEAFDLYELNSDEILSEVFSKIYLVLEHGYGSFHYLIEVDINRSHEVGKYPIELKINGMLQDFKANSDTEADEIKKKMKSILNDQESYNKYVTEKENEFNNFLQSIKISLMKFIQCDDVKIETKKKLVAPKEKIKGRKSHSIDNSHYNYHYDPVYCGYYGIADYFYYSMLWSSFTHDNNYYINDLDIYSDTGEVLGSIGEENVDASNLNLLDESTNYDDAVSHDSSFFGGGDDMDMNIDDSSSWFDSDSSFDDFGDFGDFDF